MNARLPRIAVMLIALGSGSAGLRADEKVKPPKVPKTWAWTAPVAVVPPEVKRPGAVLRNPIDRFVEARLEAAGIEPLPEADRATLIRRVCLDLTGLPPSPEMIDAFINDAAPDAYEKLVDRLLASNRYGERQARHWLDLVRYADSEGYRFDWTRPYAWRYRDWVIRSINADLPFDRFLEDQLAGDELRPDDPEAWIATGFYRHYPLEESDPLLFKRRESILADITDTVGAAVLGVTVACARCHDHKFDPITQADYYRLQAFFAGHYPVEVPLAKFPADKRIARDVPRWERASGTLRKQLDTVEAEARQWYRTMAISRYPPEVKACFDTPAERRSPLEKAIVHEGLRQATMPREKVEEKLGKNNQWRQLIRKWDALVANRPEWAGSIQAWTDVGPRVPSTHIPGKPGAPGPEVEPGFLSAITKVDPRIELPGHRRTSGRRTALVRWLNDPEHPLVARVQVNRLWMNRFGSGIVATPGDLGLQGGKPSHPELLDWLAREFVRKGRSMKGIDRLIVTSAAYRRASRGESPAAGRAAERDPSNMLLWRMNRRRMDAEAVRDSLLAAAGTLDTTMFGPGVFPLLPDGVRAPDLWRADADRKPQNRRSIYLFHRRNFRYPLLGAFDQPEPSVACTNREETHTPGQALVMFNDRAVLLAARDTAREVIRSASGTEERVRLAFLRTLGRPPTPAEAKLATEFLARRTGEDGEVARAGSVGRDSTGRAPRRTDGAEANEVGEPASAGIARRKSAREAVASVRSVNATEVGAGLETVAAPAVGDDGVPELPPEEPAMTPEPDLEDRSLSAADRASSKLWADLCHVLLCGNAFLFVD
jgi:hypothetical protein